MLLLQNNIASLSNTASKLFRQNKEGIEIWAFFLLNSHCFLFQVLWKFTILVDKDFFFFFGRKLTHFLTLHKYPDSKNKQRKGIGVEWRKRSAREGETRRRKVLWVTQQKDSGYGKEVVGETRVQHWRASTDPYSDLTQTLPGGSRVLAHSLDVAVTLPASKS